MPLLISIMGQAITGVAGLHIYVSGPDHDARSRLAMVTTCRRLEAAGASADYPHHGDGPSCRRARERNISALLSADLLVLLPGWEASFSASIDAMTADGARIPCAVLAEERISA